MYELHDDNTVRFNGRVVGHLWPVPMTKRTTFWDGGMDGARVDLAPSREAAFDRLVKAATYGLKA